MVEVNDFGRFLEEQRHASGFKSQRQLADKTNGGVSAATISRIESNIQKPLPETIRVLSQYLKSTSYKEMMDKAGYIEEELLSPIEQNSVNDIEKKERARHARNLRDARKFLEQADVMFDGVPMSEEDKKQILGYMEGMFWKAKEMNRRKPKE